MINLNLFCDPSREKLKAPFNIGDYTYATNGHIIIRVDKDPVYDGNIGIDPANLPFNHGRLNWVDLPDMPRPVKCSQCGGTGRILECNECDGDGAITFNNEFNSYEINCKSCDGDGFVDGNDRVCPSCDGRKKLHPRGTSVRYQGYRMALNLLEKIKMLPNPKLAFVSMPDANTYPPIRFKFDGGCGLLMPMRRRGNGK